MNDYKLYGDYVEREPNTATIAIASLLIGAGIGALISLLFAPRSGEQTRQFLQQKYDDTVRGISRQAGKPRYRGAGLVEATRNKVTPFARREEQA